MRLETKFNRGEQVHIPELKRNGFVVAIWFGDIGLQYQVRYFDNGEAKTVYFFEQEIAAL